MQDLIKRYFWVVGAATVMVCAVFAAKATGHVVAATVLADSAQPPPVHAVMPSPSHPVKAAHTKDGSAFAKRNMFCSDCEPPPQEEVVTDPSSIAITTLPLVLLATNVSANDAQSYATLVNTSSEMQGAYSIGDAIPGASGKLKEIHYKYIDFENNGHIERLTIAGANVPPPSKPATRPVVHAGNDLEASLENGIKKTSDNSFVIDKGLVDRMLANPMAVARGARIVPAVKNGKPDGFKLYAIRPSSVYAKLGLMTGDTLPSVNGFQLNSADKALEAYTKLREATSLELDITRRGKPVTLKYTIR
jgi:general secretion pathway protein C